jgi:hypothetical protein
MKKRFTALLLSTGLLIANQAIMPKQYHANYKISYEKLDITKDEEMGLVGLSMLFDLDKYWYAGVSLYGAVDGERGGFFTVGADAGLTLDMTEDIALRSGLFIGAGGGGAAPQGGGLMLRPYIEANYHTQAYAIGIGISHINFPNGEIESTQAYLNLSFPTTGSYLNGHHFEDNISITPNGDTWEADEVELSFLAEHYLPSDSSLNTDGKTKTKAYSLAGIRFDKQLGEYGYSFFQAAGAGGGDSDGYMEVFGGVGYRYRLGALPLYVGLEAALGASGGGKVDTGGGLVYKAAATLKAELSEHITLGASAGMIDAIDGTFSATTYSATIGYQTILADTVPATGSHAIEASPWSIRALQKSYLDEENLFKNPTKENRVDLLGFALDYAINEHFYITGQTFWAYKGDAGGYAEGIFGLGYHSGSYHGLSLYGEALAGVGGGGGISIGGGLFGSIGGGLSYELGNDTEAFVGAAYERSKDGTFSTTVGSFGLRYSFSLLEKR